MKTKTLISSISIFLLIALTSAFAMGGEPGGDIEKTSSRKVEIVRNNNELSITISTSENGETKTEVLKGTEAEKWLKENPLKNHSSAKTNVKNENGKTVISSSNSRTIIIQSENHSSTADSTQIEKRLEEIGMELKKMTDDETAGKKQVTNDTTEVIKEIEIKITEKNKDGREKSTVKKIVIAD